MIHYPVKIQVCSNTLTGAVTSKPTSFAPEAEQNVTLTLMNTRNGDVKNIVITPEGSGIDSNPSVELVSTIAAGSSTDVSFGITPHQATDLTFNVSYQDGDNTHFTDVVLPINLGQDKTAAVPVVNDVELTSSGAVDEITGDVTNAGITDAYGVIVTVRSPAVSTGTYPEYAIGSIASDDSGSFDITFTANDLSAVPLIVTWKDSAGNDYNVTKVLDLNSGYSGRKYRQQQHHKGFRFNRFGRLHDGWPRRDERRTRRRYGPKWQQHQCHVALFGQQRRRYQFVLPGHRSSNRSHCRHCPVEKAEMDLTQAEKTTMRDRT